MQQHQGASLHATCTVLVRSLRAAVCECARLCLAFRHASPIVYLRFLPTCPPSIAFVAVVNSTGTGTPRLQKKNEMKAEIKSDLPHRFATKGHSWHTRKKKKACNNLIEKTQDIYKFDTKTTCAQKNAMKW